MNTFDVNHFKVENNKYLFEKFFDSLWRLLIDVLIMFSRVDIQELMTSRLIRKRVDGWKCWEFQIKNENTIEHQQPF